MTTTTTTDLYEISDSSPWVSIEVTRNGQPFAAFLTYAAARSAVELWNLFGEEMRGRPMNGSTPTPPSVPDPAPVEVEPATEAEVEAEDPLGWVHRAAGSRLFADVDPPAVETSAYLTAEEVSKIFRCSNSHIYSLLKTGKLRGSRNGRSWRISVADLIEYQSRIHS